MIKSLKERHAINSNMKESVQTTAISTCIAAWQNMGFT